MKMKKIFVILFLNFLLLFNFTYVLCSDETSNKISVTAGSAILIDNKTNKILYSKNENNKMYPASTTKILTAIIVLENCNLDEVVTASYDAVMSVPEGYATANIEIGEQLTVSQLLELLLVPSANDAACVLANKVGGSESSFVSIMNTKLNELNLTDSHFTNCYGKNDENHYTTAHDLAYIMKYCLKNENFRKFAGKASCSIPATNMHSVRTYTSTNELLIPNTTNYYKYLTVGKTGFTAQAKECLVSASYKDDLELICVVLGSNKRFVDTRSLYDYGYSNFSLKNIVNEKDVITSVKVSNSKLNSQDLELLSNENISALVENSYPISSVEPKITLNDNIGAPIDEGAHLGKVSYTIDGIDYTTDLIASRSVEKSNLLLYISYGCFGLLIFFFIYKIFFHDN